MIGTSLERRNSATASSAPRSVAPAASARSEERGRTGPSAIGSLKGMPSSIMSAPARSRASSSGTVSAGSGSPNVRNGTNPASPRSRKGDKHPASRRPPQGPKPPGAPPPRRVRPSSQRPSDEARHGLHVLVATPGKADDENLLLVHRRRKAR